MLSDPCLEQNVGQRRIFWTTRPEACGEYNLCGAVCSIPGLEYEEIADPYPDQDPPDDPHGYRTIKNDGWLHGLILNILNTRARNDARCPTPAAVFGHWSESYRDDGLYIGSTLWNAAEKPHVRTADAEKAVANAVRSDMGKLVAQGIAQQVEVDAKSISYGHVAIVITVIMVTGRSKLNLSGSFVSETWVWH